MMTRCYCVAFSPLFDPRMGKASRPPLPLQAQAADDLELNSKQQLRAILKIVSRLADNKTKPEIVSRLADDKTKQVAAASTEAMASPVLLSPSLLPPPLSASAEEDSGGGAMAC